MNLKSVEEIVKETAKGFEYELYLLRKRSLKISTENGNFEKVSTAEDFGLALRLQKDGKVGFAYTTDLNENALKNFVENLREITELMPPEPERDFLKEKLETLCNSPFDEESIKKPLDEKIDFVVNFERSVINSHPFVKGTRETTFSEIVYEVFYKNSYGVDFSYSGTAYSLITSALAESPKGDRNISWGYKAARYLSDLNLDRFRDELVEKVVSTLDPKPFESKTLPVIFFREAFASLLETFSPLFSGENALKGKTPLRGREGEKLASDFVNIVDDGTLKRGFATHPYDDEGFPQKRTPVVENGIFKGFYHSLYSARKMGVEPTGNGFRSSFLTPPEAAHSNFYLEGGNIELKELLRSEKEVLLIFDLMGLHTADTVSGDFSLGANGVYFKKGERVQAVRGISVAGNFLKLLADIEAIANDLEFYGSVGSPSVLVKNITVGGV